MFSFQDILDDSIKAQWSVEPRFVMEVCDLQVAMSASRGRTPASRGSHELEAASGGALSSRTNNLAKQGAPFTRNFLDSDIMLFGRICTKFAFGIQICPHST